MLVETLVNPSGDLFRGRQLAETATEVAGADGTERSVSAPHSIETPVDICPGAQTSVLTTRILGNFLQTTSTPLGEAI